MNNPRKTPSQQRSRFTYDTILEAAARVFDREGMSATTNRIAERAGVSVGSLYQYFPNKQALLHELALRHVDRAEAAFVTVLDHIHASRPSLETVVTDLVTLAVRENAPLCQAHQVLREHAPRTVEIKRRFQRFIDVVVDGLVVYLAPSADETDETTLRVRLVLAALDSQIHEIVLVAATPQQRQARTTLVIEQALSMINGAPSGAGSCSCAVAPEQGGEVVGAQRAVPGLHSGQLGGGDAYPAC